MSTLPTLINPDIDSVMIPFVSLHGLSKLGIINRNFNAIVNENILVRQWRQVRDKSIMPHLFPDLNAKLNIKLSPDNLFNRSCGMGFLEYSKYLVENNDIDIHNNRDCAFGWSCENGHLEMAQWLIHLSRNGHGQINVYYNNNYPMKYSRENGHVEITLWLCLMAEMKYISGLNINEYTVAEFLDIFSANYDNLQELPYQCIKIGDHDYDTSFGAWILFIGEKNYRRLQDPVIFEKVCAMAKV